MVNLGGHSVDAPSTVHVPVGHTVANTAAPWQLPAHTVGTHGDHSVDAPSAAHVPASLPSATVPDPEGSSIGGEGPPEEMRVEGGGRWLWPRPGVQTADALLALEYWWLIIGPEGDHLLVL